MNIDLTGWAIFVHLAAITQVIGFFFRDQIILRSLVLIGSLLYIVYYARIDSVPLWEAMFWSAVLAAVNFAMLIRLLSDKVLIFKDEEDARLFRMFHGFTPGMYRKLLHQAKMVRADKITQLTKEGENLDKLYFVIEGGIRINKQGKEFDYMPGSFVGEVVFLSGGNASATVTVPSGASFYEWQNEKLTKLFKHNPEIKINFEALLNRDLANKVRFS